MNRRDFLRTGIIGCCGAALSNSVADSVFAGRLSNEKEYQSYLSAFYSLTDIDFKRLADIAIETAKKGMPLIPILEFASFGISELILGNNGLPVSMMVKILVSV